MFDTKQAVSLLEQMNYLKVRLESMPQLIPIAKDVFAPLFGEDPAPTPRLPRKTRKKPRRTVKKVTPEPKRRRMSLAQRKKLRRAAKARWKLAKKAGKNTIGGAVK